MAKVKLTDVFIKSLKAPASGRTEISDTERPGLRLRLSASGKFVWMYERRIKDGPKRKHTLGPYPQLSIKGARKFALELELEAMQGVDRVAIAEFTKKEMERTSASRTNVADVLSSYVVLQLSELKTGRERERMLRQALAPYMDQPIDQLRRMDLQSIIDAKAKEGRKVYANRFQAALSAFANFAWTRGYTETHIGSGLTKAITERPRERAPNISEIRTILAASYTQGTLWGPLLRLLIFTAQRRSEIANLRWSEVDFARRTISLRAARTKNSKPHTTHLSEPALQELEGMWERKKGSEFVFTTTGTSPVSGLSKLKTRLDNQLGPEFEHWRFHDLRSAFATAMAEAGEPETIVDRVLNHAASGSAPSAVARVYNQSAQLPQRAIVLERWATLITPSQSEA